MATSIRSCIPETRCPNGMQPSCSRSPKPQQPAQRFPGTISGEPTANLCHHPQSKSHYLRTVPKANPIILVTIPSANPIPRAPRASTSPPPGFPQHPPAVGGRSQTPLPRAGGYGGYRHASLRARGDSGWRQQHRTPGAAPSGLRGAGCVLPTSRKVPAASPNLRRGGPRSLEPGGDLLPPAPPAPPARSREARPQLAPSAHPRCARRLCPAGGGGGRKKKREGGSSPVPPLGRAAQPGRRRALLRGGGGPQQCLPP